VSRLTILNYHNVDIVPTGAQMAKLYVSPLQFDRQCWWLKKLGIRGVSLSQGLAALRAGDASRCAVLTFDDGYLDNLSHAAPIMKQYGFSATCYVVAGRLAQFNTWDAEKLQVKKPLMNATQVQEWLAAGHEVGSHTMTHPHLDQLSRPEAELEIVASKQRLEDLCAQPVKHFCYPYGAHGAETIALVRAAGYHSAVTTQRGLVNNKNDLLRLPRVSINGNKGMLRFVLKTATPYAAIGQRKVA
jgi:peptidoglycan/xylan/chitin deacetylase (PgdA/CDA1 family)